MQNLDRRIRISLGDKEIFLISYREKIQEVEELHSGEEIRQGNKDILSRL